MTGWSLGVSWGWSRALIIVNDSEEFGKITTTRFSVIQGESIKTMHHIDATIPDKVKWFSQKYLENTQDLSVQMSFLCSG